MKINKADPKTKIIFSSWDWFYFYMSLFGKLIFVKCEDSDIEFILISSSMWF